MKNLNENSAPSKTVQVVCGEESHIRGYKTSFMAKREEYKQKQFFNVHVYDNKTPSRMPEQGQLS